ncbi:hypothetical protein KIPB_000342, partial [Kipferlia bialata]|eukprot:g342.t1
MGDRLAGDTATGNMMTSSGISESSSSSLTSEVTVLSSVRPHNANADVPVVLVEADPAVNQGGDDGPQEADPAVKLGESAREEGSSGSLYLHSSGNTEEHSSLGHRRVVEEVAAKREAEGARFQAQMRERYCGVHPPPVAQVPARGSLESRNTTANAARF